MLLSDCQLLCDAINGYIDPHWEASSIIEDICSNITSFFICEISWINRDRIRDAHLLAQLGLLAD